MGSGEGGPDLLTSFFPAPTPALTPQALPRRKIQLVSSNCSAEEPEKGAGEKGDPLCGWGVLGGGRLREGDMGDKQLAYVCVFVSLNVSLHVIVCPQVLLFSSLFPVQTRPS